MRILGLKAIFAMAVFLGACISHSVAQNPSETVLNGKVVNSTFTFTNIGVSGPGNFALGQTTIPNLNSLNPPVTLELVLQSITYTETTVVGDGQAPTISFFLSPTLGNVVSSFPSIPVTLTAAPIANGVTENNVVFSLSSPVIFGPVGESNPGNTNEGTGTWQESISNLEPTPDSIVTANGSFTPSSVQNQFFNFSGDVEVIYATPEPSSWQLALVATGLFYILRRRVSRLSQFLN